MVKIEITATAREPVVVSGGGDTRVIAAYCLTVKWEASAAVSEGRSLDEG